jgi:hypothetical protein
MESQEFYSRQHLKTFSYKTLLELKTILESLLINTHEPRGQLSYKERYERVTWEMIRKIQYGQTNRAQTPPKTIYTD